MHRIGRTARGGSSGTAVTLVVCGNEAEVAVLEDIQAFQPEVDNGAACVTRPASSTQRALHPSTTRQPMRMQFDIREIEQFRYRVSDVAKRITRVMIREARLAELKAEIINSDRLRDYFARHPDDLKILRHDKTTLKLNERSEHLKHVPDYLMPTGVQLSTTNPANRRRKKKRAGIKWQQGAGANQERRKDNDPLQNFSAAALSCKGGGSRGGRHRV